MGESKGHILLVDDEEELVTRYAEILLSAGYEVKTASDGRNATALLESEKFELVISDIKMPNQNGIDLLRWINKNRPQLKMILMTGFTVEHTPQEAIDLGCHGFLAKPLSKEELLRITNDALSSQPGDKITAKDYARIPIEAFLSGRKVDFSIYVRLNDVRFLKLAHSGDDIDLPRVKDLQSRGVSELWIEQVDLPKYAATSQQIAKISAAKADWTDERRTQLLMHACDVAAETLRLLGTSTKTIESAQETLALAVNFLSESKSGSALLSVYLHASPTQFSKAATSSCLCGTIAKVLGWSAERTVMALTMAGFLRDIGLYMLPLELQEKPPHKMTPEELDLYKKHPIYSVEMLTDVENIPTETLTAISEHHEDGTPEGFPKGLPRSAILPMSKIVSMVDVFVERLLSISPRERAEPDSLVHLVETMRPKPLDEAAHQALLLLVKHGDVTKARNKLKIQGNPRRP